MACVSRHDILSCEFGQMNWDFDRAVTGSCQSSWVTKIVQIFEMPKCFAIYLRTHNYFRGLLILYHHFITTLNVVRACCRSAELMQASLAPYLTTTFFPFWMYMPLFVG